METRELLLVGIAPLLVMALISLILHGFIALKSTPTARAAWLTGIAFLLVSGFSLFLVPPNYLLIGTITSIFAALIVFWYWRADFRQRWIDDSELEDTDIALEEDDWRLAILRFLAVLAIVLGIAIVRFILRG